MRGARLDVLGFDRKHTGYPFLHSANVVLTRNTGSSTEQSLIQIATAVTQGMAGASRSIGRCKAQTQALIHIHSGKVNADSRVERQMAELVFRLSSSEPAKPRTLTPLGFAAINTKTLRDMPPIPMVMQDSNTSNGKRNSFAVVIPICVKVRPQAIT